MSVEFDVCKCSLDEDGWEEVLGEWAGEQPDEELFREPVFQEGTAFLLGRGSVRGAVLTLAPEDQVVHLRLNALASRADWRRAFQVVRRALERAGGEVVREDGVTFGAAQLTDAEAEAQGTRDFCASLEVVQGGLKEGEVTLPLDNFGLVVRPGELPGACTPAEVPGLEDRLAARVERLALAFPSATFVLQGGLRLATWALIPTLVGEADLVSIEGLQNPVPLDALKQALGPRAEAAGEGVVLLPELDDQADAALLERLRAAGVDLTAFARARGIEVPEGGFEAPGGEAPELDDGELPSLYAPLAVAIARVVAAASQGQDPRLVRRALLREGLDEQVADLALHVVGRVLGELFDARGEPTERTPEDLIQALVADGLPPMVAEVSVATIAQLLGGGDEAEEPDEPEEPRTPGGLILPPGMR